MMTSMSPKGCQSTEEGLSGLSAAGAGLLLLLLLLVGGGPTGGGPPKGEVVLEDIVLCEFLCCRTSPCELHNTCT